MTELCFGAHNLSKREEEETCFFLNHYRTVIHGIRTEKGHFSCTRSCLIISEEAHTKFKKQGRQGHWTYLHRPLLVFGEIWAVFLELDGSLFFVLKIVIAEIFLRSCLIYWRFLIDYNQLIGYFKLIWDTIEFFWSFILITVLT